MAATPMANEVSVYTQPASMPGSYAVLVCGDVQHKNGSVLAAAGSISAAVDIAARVQGAVLQVPLECSWQILPAAHF